MPKRVYILELECATFGSVAASSGRWTAVLCGLLLQQGARRSGPLQSHFGYTKVKRYRSRKHKHTLRVLPPVGHREAVLSLQIPKLYHTVLRGKEKRVKCAARKNSKSSTSAANASMAPAAESTTRKRRLSTPLSASPSMWVHLCRSGFSYESATKP